MKIQDSDLRDGEGCLERSVVYRTGLGLGSLHLCQGVASSETCLALNESWESSVARDAPG